MEQETTPSRIIDKREKPIETEIAEFLISKGIYTLEQVKELLEPNFYAIIPISILEKKSISANAKLLYAEIMALSKKSGKCFATNEYLADRMGLSKRTVPSLLKELRDDLLIQVSIKRNKDGTYRDITVSLIGDGGARRRAIRGIAKKRGQKRNRQREINKENKELATLSVAGKDIQLLIDKFKQVNPSYVRLFANKTQRGAVERLVKQYGVEKVGNMIDYLPKIFGKPYAPRITSPYLLEQKLAELISYLKAEKEKEGKVWKL